MHKGKIFFSLIVYIYSEGIMQLNTDQILCLVRTIAASIGGEHTVISLFWPLDTLKNPKDLPYSQFISL